MKAATAQPFADSTDTARRANPGKCPTGRVLVVDDHDQARQSMAEVLRCAGHEVTCCSSAAEALSRLGEGGADCVVTDMKMPGMSGLELIQQIEQRRLRVQVVMVTAHASVSSAVDAMRHGAFDYIEKPFDVDQLEQLVGQAIRHGGLVAPANADSELGGARPGVPQDGQPTEPVMIGDSPAMQALRQRIAQIAPTDETVLILGESGTGKELVARAIHTQSRRANKTLVSLNCPVLSAHLMESELFGHERGAFTGADAPRSGRFEMADDSSILLDEVTEIDLNLQAKLLRVLQEKSFERVGSSHTRHVDVRVLATTNRDLTEQIREGRFREDLYYRLAVLPIHVPPLRDRREDVTTLCDHFFTRCATRLDREPCQLESAARQLLLDYHWPGNVRELENIATRASVLSQKGHVRADELRRWLVGQADALDASRATGSLASGNAVSGNAVSGGGLPVGVSLQEMERQLIEATLEHFDGHRARTAEALGIGVRTLSGKLRQYGYAPHAKVKGG
jgi:DNA-binding NtrC family response regulator